MEHNIYAVKSLSQHAAQVEHVREFRYITIGGDKTDSLTENVVI